MASAGTGGHFAHSGSTVTTTMLYSAVTGNYAGTTSSSAGGGIVAYKNTLVLKNTDVHSNSAPTDKVRAIPPSLPPSITFTSLSSHLDPIPDRNRAAISSSLARRPPRSTR